MISNLKVNNMQNFFNNILINDSFVQGKINYTIKMLKSRSSNPLKSNYYIKSYPLFYNLFNNQDNIENVNYYTQVFNTNKVENFYMLENIDNVPNSYHLKSLSQNDNFRLSIDIKEIILTMNRKLDSFFESKLEQYIVFGMTNSQLYFYMDIKKENDVVTHINEVVICKIENELLSFIGEKFSIKPEIFEIKAQLFKNYLEKKLLEKDKIKSKMKL